jgi:hypothetical protein
MGSWRSLLKTVTSRVRYWTKRVDAFEGAATPSHMDEIPKGKIIMVSRIRKTLTVEQRAAAFEHTNKIATDFADEERRLRHEKSERLRRMRLAANQNPTSK